MTRYRYRLLHCTSRHLHLVSCFHSNSLQLLCADIISFCSRNFYNKIFNLKQVQQYGEGECNFNKFFSSCNFYALDSIELFNTNNSQSNNNNELKITKSYELTNYCRDFFVNLGLPTTPLAVFIGISLQYVGYSTVSMH